MSTSNSTPSTPNSTLSSSLPGELQGLELREQILVLIKKHSTISKKKITEILGISMYALKKELATLSEEHVADTAQQYAKLCNINLFVGRVETCVILSRRDIHNFFKMESL